VSPDIGLEDGFKSCGVVSDDLERSKKRKEEVSRGFFGGREMGEEGRERKERKEKRQDA